MIKKYYLIAAIQLILISGCEKVGDTNVNTEQKIEISNHIITRAQAIEIAKLQATLAHEFRNKKLNSTKKAASVTKEIKHIFDMKKDQSDPTFYIINYDGGGFAIVSGDDRLHPILAFSEDNSFPISETIEYPNGLVQWMQEIDDQVKIMRSENEKQSKTVELAWKKIQEKSNNTIKTVTTSADQDDQLPATCSYQGESIALIYQKDPRLTTTWGQGVGYNDQLTPMGCTSYSNGKPPVGCVATATAQIMKYYQYPNTYNWASMPNSYGTTETARLMKDIGIYVDMDWQCNGSGTQTSKAATALKNNFGYSSATSANYNYQTVSSELSAIRPVILSGGRVDKWWFFNVYADGHAWVSDGIRRISYYTCEIPPYEDSEPYWIPTYSYLHFYMNWGWSGQLNGWYGYNNWNPGTNTFNYQPGMITNIRP